MAQKVTFSSATTVNPVGYYQADHGLIQLSDGTPAFILGNGASPQVWSLAVSPDRATVQTVATLGAGAGSAGTSGMSVARDAADNLYVMRPAGAGYYEIDTFAKGSGYAWTAKPTVTLMNPPGGTGSGMNLLQSALVWMNTGGGAGGAGHLLCQAMSSGGPQYVFTVDAGTLLAGTSTTIISSWNASNTLSGAQPNKCDLEPDGFGSTTVVSLIAPYNNANASNPFAVGSLQVLTVTSAGGLTFGGSASLPSPVSIQYNSDPAWVVRVAPGTFLILGVAAGTSPQQYAAVPFFSASGTLGTASASGAITGLPSANQNISAFRDPTTTNRAQIIGMANGTTSPTQVNRIPVTITGSGSTASVTWGAAIADDSLTVAGPPYAMRVVRQPVRANVDWHACLGSSTYTTVGDYTTLDSPPNAPGLNSPVGNAYVDYTQATPLQWRFSDPDAGDSQSKADVQWRVSGASTWTSILGAATTATTYTFPANTWTSQTTIEWQVRTYDSIGVVGPWSTSGFFVATAPTPAPTITAPAAGATIAASTTTVSWSAPNQAAYQVRTVADSSGTANTSTVYNDTGTVVDTSSRSRTVACAGNITTEHVQVRVQYQGLWSPWADARFTVSYTAPPALTATLTTQDGSGSLLVAHTIPAPTGTQPTVTSVDIYVDDGQGGGLTRRATGVTPGASWTYFLPVSSRDYSGNVTVVAIGANGTTSSATAT